MNKRPIPLLLSLFGVVMVSPYSVASDATDEAYTELETVVVTGEKISRSLEETASSVQVFTAEEIENSVGNSSVSDVIKNVPNLIYTDTTGAPVIRGQDTQGPNFGSTAFLGGTIPRAAINLDGHYLSYNEFVYGASSIWDVESIEVFRGPQTSAQGANSIAGAIIVNTKDPTFINEGAARFEYGSRDMMRASVVASGPLSDDFAARAAFDFSGRDTFIDYTNPSFLQGETDQDLEYKNLRFKLLWVPEDIEGLEAKLTVSRTENNGPTWESASTPYDELDNVTASMPSWTVDVNTVIADVAYDLSETVQFVNQLQFSNLHVNRVSEPFTNGSAIIDQKNTSNEVRLVLDDNETDINGVVGMYIARTTSDDTLYIRGVSDFDDQKDNLGLFSEINYPLSDAWTLTTGLRYQRDRIQRSGTSGFAPSATLNYDETFTAWLPKVSLAYAVNPEVTVGALLSRGYTPGGVNLSFVSADYITFDEETTWNYELFTRAKMLDGRLMLAGNVFYSDHKDSQRLLPDYLGSIPYGSTVVNADEAKSYGLEVSMNFQARENLNLRAGAGLLQSEIGQFTDALGNHYEGNEFGRAPGYMITLGADWQVTEKVVLSGDIRHTDGYYSTDENDPDYEVDNYTVANARMTYAVDDNIEIYTFANNIFDERAETYKFDDRSIGGIAANVVEPLELGVGLNVSF